MLFPNFLSLPKKSELPKIWGGCSPPRPPGPYAYENTGLSNIPGYVFEHVPTPLACGGVGLFVDETISYSVLEKASTESFQALWIEISFIEEKRNLGSLIPST